MRNRLRSRLRNRVKNRLQNRLKYILVGKEFKEEDYNEDLSKIAKRFNLELNTTDFNFNRLYKYGYKHKQDWDNEHVASLYTKAITKHDKYGYQETFIKIVDVF